ncbi:L-cysteine desulfhydrase [Geodia barretti]|uniref:L-cysteine desulfhydrase n=1 Tax=Geodia barretti TaxID=519541 RepID=A0AA35U0P9_GEOBA|nr:L-cysteine desulfhydrase [Geodia barretti]
MNRSRYGTKSRTTMDAAASKRDFGSFHSSNVEELLRLPEEVYQPPKIPVDLPSFSSSDLKFGREAKEAHFHLSASWTFINHGAFGAVLKEALAAAAVWQVYCERQPLRFLDRELLPLLAFTTRRLADFIDATPSELALVPNVTTGINSVIRSVCKTFSPQDSVLIFNTTYGAVKKLVRTVSEEVGFSVHELVIHFPLHSHSQILETLESGLREHESVKLVIADHISSNYGIIFPVKVGSEHNTLPLLYLTVCRRWRHSVILEGLKFLWTGLMLLALYQSACVI